MVSKRYGKELNFLIPPDAPRLAETFGPLHHLLTRPFQPLRRRIAVETINEGPAPQSPYLPALRAAFEVVVDYKFVNLSRPRNSIFPD
jgi:ATP-dependent helicase Lhr and Lhr-like helicase